MLSAVDVVLVMVISPSWSVFDTAMSFFSSYCIDTLDELFVTLTLTELEDSEDFVTLVDEELAELLVTLIDRELEDSEDLVTEIETLEDDEELDSLDFVTLTLIDDELSELFVTLTLREDEDSELFVTLMLMDELDMDSQHP